MTKHVTTKNASIHVHMAELNVVVEPNVWRKIIKQTVFAQLEHKETR